MLFFTHKMPLLFVFIDPFPLSWVPLFCPPHNLSIIAAGARIWDEGHVMVCCRAEPWAELRRWYSQDCHCFSPNPLSLQATSLNGVHSETSPADSISMTRSLQPGCIWALFSKDFLVLTRHTLPWPCGFHCTSFSCVLLSLRAMLAHGGSSFYLKYKWG